MAWSETSVYTGFGVDVGIPYSNKIRRFNRWLAISLAIIAAQVSLSALGLWELFSVGKSSYVRGSTLAMLFIAVVLLAVL